MTSIKFPVYKNSIKHAIVEGSVALLILLFSYTSIMKLSEHNKFKGVLSQSDLIGRWANGIAWIIPFAELSTIILLFLPLTRRIGLMASTMLMSVLTVYVGYMIVFMPHLPCSCGGVIDLMTWPQHLVFNIVFTAIAAHGYFISKSGNTKLT